MKLAICNETYRDWDWARAFAHARSHGYSGLEIAPFTIRSGDSPKISATAKNEMMRLAKQEGLELIGLHWLLAFTEGYHLTSPDPSTQKRTANYLIELTDLCAELGGQVMVFGSPQQRSLQKGVSNQAANEIAISIIENALPHLEKNNIVLALEPLGKQETDFLNTADETIALCKKLNSPFVRLHLDVKAMSSEQLSIPEIIANSKDWIEHFHANDPNLRGPGMGDVDFEPILKALEEVGYSKWISVEVFDQTASVESLVEESSAYLRKLNR